MAHLLVHHVHQRAVNRAREGCRHTRPSSGVANEFLEHWPSDAWPDLLQMSVFNFTHFADVSKTLDAAYPKPIGDDELHNLGCNKYGNYPKPRRTSVGGATCCNAASSLGQNGSISAH